VTGWSPHLADRARLGADLDAADDYEVLLTELKAAAVDVAASRALARGADVVFLDNRAHVVEGRDLGDAIVEFQDLAVGRATERAIGVQP
jgi:cyclic 2,3-diphosphoglycerate synthetase